jgi:hypothetical protein
MAEKNFDITLDENGFYCVTMSMADVLSFGKFAVPRSIRYDVRDAEGTRVSFPERHIGQVKELLEEWQSESVR